MLFRPCAMFAAVALAPLTAQSKPATSPPTVSVYLLAGQSNMEGQAVVDLDHEQHYNGGRGNLEEVLSRKVEGERFAVAFFSFPHPSRILENLPQRLVQIRVLGFLAEGHLQSLPENPGRAPPHSLRGQMVAAILDDANDDAAQHKREDSQGQLPRRPAAISKGSRQPLPALAEAISDRRQQRCNHCNHGGGEGDQLERRALLVGPGQRGHDGG